MNTKRYEVFHMRLDRGGYHRGQYFGNVPGTKVYRVYDLETGKVKEVRAENAKAARRKAIDDRYGWR